MSLRTSCNVRKLPTTDTTKKKEAFLEEGDVTFGYVVPIMLGLTTNRSQGAKYFGVRIEH